MIFAYEFWIAAAVTLGLVGIGCYVTFIALTRENKK